MCEVVCVWNEWIVLGGKSVRGGSFLTVFDSAGKLVFHLTGHKGAGRPVFFIKSNIQVRDITVWNGNLVSGSNDKTIRIWDTAGNCLRTLEGHKSSVNCLQVYNNHLCSGGKDNK